MNVKLAPSILSADFANLGQAVREATDAGADYIHIDVMDGHFVPPITVGAGVVSALRPHTNLPLDVHLMVSAPERHIEDFAAALRQAQGGADRDIITVHAEAASHLHRTVQRIKELGCRAGVSLNPASPLSLIEEVLVDVDLVLLMTVNPGYGGQEFIPSMLLKIARLRQLLDEGDLPAELEVDGGINADIAPKVVEAGGRVLVAGNAVFGQGIPVAEAMARLRDSLKA